MRTRPDTVKDIEGWRDAMELDNLGANLSQWEIDFLEDIINHLIEGKTLTATQRCKLVQIVEERVD